jgi:hypothetical protein
MNKRFGLLLAAAILIVALPALAGESETSEMSVKPIGEVFFNWHYNSSGYPDWYAGPGFPVADGVDLMPLDMVKDHQAFQATRVFLGAKADITRNLSAKIVFDIAGAIPDAGDDDGDDDDSDDDDDSAAPLGNGVIAKYAWANYRIMDAFNLRAGILGTSYIAFENWAYDYRWVQAASYELWRHEPESDLGLAILGKFPGGYGSYQAGIYNGEGAANAEVNRGKAIDLRVTVNPAAAVDAAKDLSLTFTCKYEKDDPDIENWTAQFGGLVHYRNQFTDNFRLNIGLGMNYQIWNPIRNAEVVDDKATLPERENSFAMTFFFDLQVYQGLGFFFRIDYWDPDLLNDKKLHGYQDEHDLVIGGVSYEFNKYVQVALDYQGWFYTEKIPNDQGKDVVTPTDHFIYANWRFAF